MSVDTWSVYSEKSCPNWQSNFFLSPGGPNGESGYILGALRICRKSSRPTNADTTECQSLSKHETAVRSCLQFAPQPGRIWLLNSSQVMFLRSPSGNTLSTAFSQHEKSLIPETIIGSQSPVKDWRLFPARNSTASHCQNSPD